MTGIGFAKENVWSRASRRRLSRAAPPAETEDAMDEDDDEDNMAFGFKIQLSQVDTEDGTAAAAIKIRWLKGDDSVLFESFCGMMKRKMASNS
jgi:23S rRNA (adenine1618-N6)-methyltransferase